jgi:uncharacterized membrane protein HdeD (DUF308 family)
MARTIGKGSWIITLKGIVALIFGLVALFYPGMTVAVLTQVFGFMLLIAGVIFIVGAIFHTKHNQSWSSWLFEGIIDLIMGLIIIAFPIFAVGAFMILIAIWALIMGIWRIYLAFKFTSQRGILLFGGIISLIFGILVLINPFAGAGAIMIVIGIWAIIFGLSVIFRSFQ